MSESLIKLLITKTAPLVKKIYSMQAGAPVVEEANPGPGNKQRKPPVRKGIWAKFSV